MGVEWGVGVEGETKLGIQPEGALGEWWEGRQVVFDLGVKKGVKKNRAKKGKHSCRWTYILVGRGYDDDMWVNR